MRKMFFRSKKVLVIGLIIISICFIFCGRRALYSTKFKDMNKVVDGRPHINFAMRKESRKHRNEFFRVSKKALNRRVSEIKRKSIHNH